MDFEKVERELTAWHDARRRMLREKTRLCRTGPSMAAVYLALTGRREMSREELRHLEACDDCGRQRDRIAAMLRSDGGEAGLGGNQKHDSTQRERHKTATRARPRGVGLSGLFGQRARRWAYGTVGLAVAACAAWFFFSPAVVPKAYAGEHTLVDIAKATAPWLRLVGSKNVVIDPNSAEAREQLEKLDGLEVAVREGLVEARTWPTNDQRLTPFCHMWQEYYCQLRDVGRRDDAIREATAALEFSRTHPVPPYESIFVDGLGNIYRAFGMLGEARAAYEESLTVRRRMNPFGNPDDPHAGEVGYEGNRWQDLVPMYLRLMFVDIAEGKLAEARSQFELAERAMKQFLHTICELDGITDTGDASLWELFNALPEPFRSPKTSVTPEEKKQLAARYPVYQPSASMCGWVRAIFYHEACLLREEGKIAEAKVSLARASEVPFDLGQDELRLPLVERIEAALIALIEKHYEAALDAVGAARAYVLDPRHDTAEGPPVNKLPLSPLRCAELDMLEGIARLGIDPRDRDAAATLRKGLHVIEAVGGDLSKEGRKYLKARLGDWERLLDGGSKSEAEDHSGTNPA